MKLRHDERLTIAHLLKQGMSCRAISSQIGRNYGTVKREVRTNGGKKNYDPEIGQKRADMRGILDREDMDDLVASVVELFSNGKTFNQIGEIMNLTVLQVQKIMLQFFFKEQNDILQGLLDRIKKIESALKCRGVII